MAWKVKERKGMAWHDMERKGKARHMKIKVHANGVVKNEKW
jgi:hypothetical protein